MDANFWLKKWKQNQIGFHASTPHIFLLRHFKKLQLKAGARILVPLCGKSLDIHRLLHAGFNVLGIELSEIAVANLFQDLGLTPSVKQIPKGIFYEAGTLRVFVGDIFAFNAEHIGPVDAVYDRAALIALPENMRLPYAQHVIHLANAAPQLLVCVEYDQSKRQGPPFSVLRCEINELYNEIYQVYELDRLELPEGIKGVSPAYEAAWCLNRKATV